MNKYLKGMLCFGLSFGIFLGVMLWATPGVMAADDSLDPNETIGTAREITAGTHLGLSIDSVDVVDYYNITLAVGDNISVEIYNMDLKLGMELYDTHQVMKNTSKGDVAQIMWWISVPETGNYTIKVYGINPGDASAYDMRIESPSFDDTYEDNDDSTHATSRTQVSTTTNLQLWDTDYYDVEVGADDYWNVTVQRASDGTGSGNFNLTVYDNAWSVLGQDLAYLNIGGSTTLVIKQVESTTQTLHVVVTPIDEFAWGNYTLILKDVEDDQWEENDAYDAARLINLDDSATIFALWDNGAFLWDADYYQVQLNAGDTLWAKATSLQLTDNITMQIRGTSDALLADMYWPSVNEASVNYTATTAGPINLLVDFTELLHQIAYKISLGRLNVSHPGDISFPAGTSGSAITWMVDDNFDANPLYGTPAALLSAKIYRNGIALDATYTWSRTKPVTVDVSGLAEGTYTFKIVAQNSLNVTVEDTVVVIVTAPLPTGVPGYPIAEFTGFMLVTVIALAFRKKKNNSQQ